MSGSLHRRSPDGGPALRKYSAIAALLAGLVLVRLGVNASASTVRAETGLFAVPLVVIAAYSLVALAGLGAVYAVYAAGRDERLDGFELVEAGLAAAAFVFVGVYVVLGPTAPDVSAATVLLPGGYAIGLGALAVGYARVADLDLPVSPPTRDGWLLTGLAVAVVAVTAALVTAGATVVGWPDSPAAAFGYSPALDATSFVLTTVIPMTLSGVGAALLFNGAVQTALRRHRSPAAAAGAVTLLAFGADWSLAVVPVALTPVLGPVPAAFRGAAALAALVPAVVVVLAVAVAYGRLWDARTPRSADGRTTIVPAGAGVVLTVAVTFATAAFVGNSVGPATVNYPVAIGVAAVAAERTRSVWAPAIVYAAHGVAIELLAYYVLSGSAGDGGVTVLSALL
ncbi:hypothetical protein ACFQMA_04705 [Halosimplex aquaticum]|uniref:Uncharacterized protein n=1 Tax=Halosimplex aquaticum TaxID=3026162 RepID=A0ABD5XZZ0_9EURY|nr:hypothetical protein [Halosimplex aquaticum]